MKSSPENLLVKQRQQEPGEEYYYSMIRPDIEKTLNFEQRQELRNVLKRIARVPSTKIVDFRTTFWFIKRFYLVVFLGLDRRRREPVGFQRELLLIAMRMAVFFVLLIVLLFLVFGILYVAKSDMGIDLFQDRHLSDFLGINREGK